MENQEEKYYEVGGGYYLSTDKYNYILSKTCLCKEKVLYRAVGYYGTLEQLYKAMIEKDIKDSPELLLNISEISKLIDERGKKLKKISEEIRKEMKNSE